jgi:hypothetical protein
MPHNSTLNTASMPTWEGRAVAVDGDGFMKDLAFKVKVTAKTAAYTVLANDSGTIFTNYGATASVTFTLPTAASGLCYWFATGAGYAIVISANELVVGFNTAAADSVSLATSSEILGGGFFVFSDGNLWYALPMVHGLGLTAQTVTTTAD